MNTGNQMPVLVDEEIADEFSDAVDRLGATFEAPSGRTYLLERSGSQLTVSVALDNELTLPPDGEVDADLLELACALYDHIGGEWSGHLLRNVVKTWAPATNDSTM